MRRGLIALGAAAAGALGCASASPPPGGPEDHAPPQLVRVTPDTNAVNVKAENVTFYFDETINDRGSGAQELGRRFLISPSDGEPRVSWHRSRIDVRPRNGFRPNTAYSVSMLPGLSDLRGNAMKSSAKVVFSTGPVIPSGVVNGVVFDWAAERPAPLALIQALTPDSTLYLDQADSAGTFALKPLPPGRYLVRGIIDANGNRALDRNEAFDTLTVDVPLAGPIELRAAARDTLPARLATVSASDSVSLRVTFDHPLEPTQQITPDMFVLAGADSVHLAITRVLTPAQEIERTRLAQQAVADSTRRADSLAGKVLPPPPRPAPPATKAARKPSVPAPFNSLLLELAKPLAPNAPYRLSARGVRGINGLQTESERTFTTPKPPPPPPPRDSTARPVPAAKPPRTP
ncbi:MAG TPA: Ig-like domain-containing protein [Gemmatimonadaceae bacterium]|nr:Ig-like domain-containing protein [Gemmatimonadaceae bacterium]